MNLVRAVKAALSGRAGPVKPDGQPSTPPAEPCPDGFHWVGQPMTCCDVCGLPAWDHDGWADNADDSPFSPAMKRRPWKPSEREAIEARWKR